MSTQGPLGPFDALLPPGEPAEPSEPADGQQAGSRWPGGKRPDWWSIVCCALGIAVVGAMVYLAVTADPDAWSEYDDQDDDQDDDQGDGSDQ